MVLVPRRLDTQSPPGGDLTPATTVDVSQFCPCAQESVDAVSGRLKSLIQELDQSHSGCTILLVAHGDTLSILTATTKGTKLNNHRIWGLETAEISCLLP